MKEAMGTCVGAGTSIGVSTYMYIGSVPHLVTPCNIMDRPMKVCAYM